MTDLPCIRVATSHGLLKGHHGKPGDLILYLTCTYQLTHYEWQIVNLETGKTYDGRCSVSWNPEAWLNECSEAL